MPEQNPKTATRADKPAKQAPERPPLYWGPTTAEFYAQLREKDVQVAFMDGKLMTGQLVGCGQFDLILRQASQGVTVLIPKHSVKWVAPANGKATSLYSGTASNG